MESDLIASAKVGVTNEVNNNKPTRLLEKYLIILLNKRSPLIILQKTPLFYIYRLNYTICLKIF